MLTIKLYIKYVLPSFDFILKRLHQIKNKHIDLQLSILGAKLISEAHNFCASISKLKDITIKITKFAFEFDRNVKTFLVIPRGSHS